MEDTIGTVLGISAGLAIGLSYPKIKKKLGPELKKLKLGEKTAAAYASTTKFFTRQKEKLQDAIARRKEKKVAPVKAAPVKAAAVKRGGRRLKKAAAAA